MDTTTGMQRLRSVAHEIGGLRLLLLHGSRARGDAGAASDWDVGYLGDAALDRLALAAAVAAVLRTDHVDVVDLASASALLRFRAARDGVLVAEPAPGVHEQFVLAAVRYWCDIEPRPVRTPTSTWPPSMRPRAPGRPTCARSSRRSATRSRRRARSNTAGGDRPRA